jgi:2,3-bisphosphoglycerate-dependent phosphoglycerate mutase
MTIYLIRHGETDWNQENRMQGQTDIGLNALGIKQAKSIANGLPSTIDAIVSSDLSRALDTARAIASTHAVTIEVDSSLREIHLGSWEGKTWQEIKANHLDSRGFPPSDAPHGGESLSAFFERSHKAFDSIVDRYRGRDVAIVTHGGVIKMILCSIRGIPIEQREHLVVDNASITVITAAQEEHHFVIVRQNDTAHWRED